MMRKFTIILMLLGISLFGFSQIWTEDFTAGTYTVTVGGEGSDGIKDYFMTTDGSNINKTYTGAVGNFFAGQDIDDGGWTGSATPSQLTWSNIDISSATTLEFSCEFASVATAKIDATDYLNFEYQVDGGDWNMLIAFENDGTTNNTFFLEDTDFDGDGDGTQLTSTFTTFTKPLVVSGSTLNIRFNVYVNSGDEDFAIENIKLTAVGGNANPVITNITQTPTGNPLSTETVAVAADITDVDGTIATATLHWGTATGSLTNDINMSATGNTYTTDTDIPAQADGTTVYYAIEAVDNEAGTSNTSEYSYTVNDPASTTLPYNEDFAAGFGDVYTYSVAGDTKQWQITNEYAQMNGYGSALEEDWMILPAVNLDTYSNEIITFETQYKYGEVDDNNYLKVFYSADYSGLGDPSTSTWTELTFTQPTEPEVWTASGSVDLSNITGTAVYIAFKYYSTDSPRRWDVDNISIFEGADNILPEITNIGISIQQPNSTQTIAVDANIVDADGTIATATLHWGTATGSLTNDINMSATGDTYTTDTDIPAQANGTTVYFTVEAEDDDAGITTSDENSYVVADPALATIPYAQPFDTDLGDFDNYSVSGDQIWYHYTYSNNGYAKMSGFSGSYNVNEDWLISPIFNLDNYSNEQLSFSSAKNYDGGSIQLFYSTDFDGLSNPATNGTWTELTDQATWSTGNYEWVNSGIIDISAINGTAVYFAFKYTSSDTDGATWQIDDFTIAEEVLVPTITVTTPNGGEQWHQSSNYNITWSFENITGNVKIELTGANNSVIAESVENTGTYNWTIPADQVLADDYKIKISSVEDNTVFDESDATFSVVSPYVPGNIVITEIMYNPPESGTDSLEFIEILNIGDYTINLDGYHFSSGVTYTFPDMDMNAGEYVVVAVNADAMTNFFGISSLQWTSGGLSNGGEAIVLKDASDIIVDSVNYDDNTPWPTVADGDGPSLVLCDPLLDNSLGENWSAATEIAGQNADEDYIYATPGAPCGTCDLTADFGAVNTTIGVGGSATFIDLTTGTPDVYEWHFEGATPETSNIQNPSDIVYNTAGTYDVTLTVYNETGSNTITKEDYITVVEAPVAEFSADVVTIPADGTVTFTDESTNNPTSWEWTFEGGVPASFSGQTPPAVSYAALGSYDVTLTVSNEYGQTTEVKTDYITVTDLPIAAFTADETVVTAGTSTTFTDESTGNPTSWEWTFEGGYPASYSGQTPPAITYNNTGVYDVTLMVTNALGENTLVSEDYISVGIAPVSDFTADNTEILTDQSVTFTDLSENNPTAWAWTFAGGTPAISSEQNPVITYTNVGLYNVSLIASNAFGEDLHVIYDYIKVSATGIETLSLEKEGVILYPNPTSGNVNIISAAPNSEVRVFSAMGKLVFTGSISATESTIDLNYLPKGIYSVQITDKSSAFNKVKQLIIK